MQSHGIQHVASQEQMQINFTFGKRKFWFETMVSSFNFLRSSFTNPYKNSIQIKNNTVRYQFPFLSLEKTCNACVYVRNPHSKHIECPMSSFLTAK